MFLSVSVSSAEVAWGRGMWPREAACQKGGCCRARLGQKKKEWGGRLCPYLVQQDDAGALQDGARDGHALLLPPAQLQPPLPHLGAVPCGHKGKNKPCCSLRDGGRTQKDCRERLSTASSAHPVSHEGGEGRPRGLTVREGKDAVVDVGGAGCLLHLLVGGQDPAVADVVGDGVVEEHRVLGHHPDVGAQRRLLHLGRLWGGREGLVQTLFPVPRRPLPTLQSSPGRCPARRCGCSRPARRRSGRAGG